jgi:hypothetical protein
LQFPPTCTCPLEYKHTALSSSIQRFKTLCHYPRKSDQKQELFLCFWKHNHDTLKSFLRFYSPPLG